MPKKKKSYIYLILLIILISLAVGLLVGKYYLSGWALKSKGTGTNTPTSTCTTYCEKTWRCKIIAGDWVYELDPETTSNTQTNTGGCQRNGQGTKICPQLQVPGPSESCSILIFEPGTGNPTEVRGTWQVTDSYCKCNDGSSLNQNNPVYS